jgi:hypothetical protein
MGNNPDGGERVGRCPSRKDMRMKTTHANGYRIECHMPDGTVKLVSRASRYDTLLPIIKTLKSKAAEKAGLVYKIKEGRELGE